MAAQAITLEKEKIIESIDEHEPNDETQEAMREAEHPERLKSYSNIREMFRAFGVDPE